MKNGITFFFMVVASWICLADGAFAQHELTTYMFGNLPQRNYLNPSFIPREKGYLGIPALSGIQAGYSNPFSYNDVLTRGSDDSLTFEVEQFLDMLGTNNRMFLTSNIDILSFGSSTGNKKFFWSFSLRERVSEQIILPPDLFNLVWYGNHDPKLFGQILQLAPKTDALAYDEYGLSFAGHAVKNKLTYGVKLKYLSGRFNIHTKKSTVEFYTDPETYDIQTTSDLDVQTSGIDNIDSYFDQSIQKLVFSGNNGFAVDLGLTYQISEKFQINGSVLDIGNIRWKNDNLELVSHEPGKIVAFNGLNLHDFVELFTDPEKFGQRVEDSLRGLIHIDSVYDVPYTTLLPTRFYLGGSFILNEHNRFNLLLSGTSFNKEFYPALSASYNLNVGRFFELMASYNVFNYQYFNIGGGLAINAGPIQFYMMSDNIRGMIAYKSTNNYSLRFGINVLLGREKSTEATTPDVQTEIKPE